MKKLSLKKLKLEAENMLQRSELKTVFGGYVSSQCGGIQHCDPDDYGYCDSYGGGCNQCIECKVVPGVYVCG